MLLMRPKKTLTSLNFPDWWDHKDAVWAVYKDTVVIVHPEHAPMIFNKSKDCLEEWVKIEPK